MDLYNEKRWSALQKWSVTRADGAWSFWYLCRLDRTGCSKDKVLLKRDRAKYRTCKASLCSAFCGLKKRVQIYLIISCLVWQADNKKGLLHLFWLICTPTGHLVLGVHIRIGIAFSKPKMQKSWASAFSQLLSFAIWYPFWVTAVESLFLDL